MKRYSIAMRARWREKAAGSILITIIFLFSVTGCSSSIERADPIRRDTTATPHFDGQWAAEFEQAWASSDSTFEQAILTDGKIDEAEYVEVMGRYRKCLKAVGITLKSTGSDGAVNILFPPKMGSERALKEDDTCSRQSGHFEIGFLYEQMRRNPAHLDEAKIVIACLMRERLVNASYGQRDWDRDQAHGTGPVAANSGQAARTCVADPLGLLK